MRLEQIADVIDNWLGHRARCARLVRRWRRAMPPLICALACLLSLAAPAAAQPASWSYSFKPSGQAQATYPGDVAISGAVTCGSGCGGTGGAVPTMASTGYGPTFTTNPAGGAITLFDSPAGVSMSSTDFGADNINAACKSVPTVPYTVTAKFSLAQDWTNGDSWAGLVWRNPTSQNLVATGPLAATDLPQPHRATVYSLLFLNPTTFSGSPIGNATTWLPIVYVRYGETSTNWLIQWSADGANFMTIYNAAKTAGYSQICMFLSAHGSAAMVPLNAYTETSP